MSSLKTTPPPKAFIAHIGELTHRAEEADKVKTGADILKESRLDPLLEVKAPPVCISIEVDGHTAVFGTLGNISVSKGKAKSKKTMFATLLMAAAIRNGTLCGIIKCSFPPEKRKIVLFDTEQGEYHVWKTVMRALTLAGGTKEEAIENFDIFCLRPYAPEQRIEAISHYLKNTPGVGMAVIDGIRDLLHDINDPAQSNRAAQHLMTWTKDHDIHIHTVIHTNKGDTNARGHIGTEITNKAETVAEVVKDGMDKFKTIVQPSECRNMEFEKFAFEVDDFGVPRLIDDYKDLSEVKESKTKYPSDISNDIHKQILIKIFLDEPEMNYSKMIPAVKVAYAAIGIKFGDNTAKDFISYFRQCGMVVFKKNGKNMNYSLNEVYKNP